MACGGRRKPARAAVGLLSKLAAKEVGSGRLCRGELDPLRSNDTANVSRNSGHHCQ